ncbi:tRNA wybutosine-synthesizing protein 5-like [Dendronephthya gigantea]|uniref:tRNA wybutosine-synthesizing protein 5-like n=1 Tax=Dendronephthya gigantea TaxID=151771 RepID=UPI00106B184B|nr:tRNA wybutosine-synthesizing protein 5-like [Dendronephthya gigantea]
MAWKSPYVTFYILLVSTFGQFQNFVSTEEDPSSWPGHMEPLGSRNVKHSVTSVDEFPTPQDFFKDYVSPSKPLLIRNGAKISPAFKLWTDEYFGSLHGAENTSVFVEQRKKENRTFPGKEISFKEFIETYNASDIYMVNAVPDILQQDVLLPPALLCEDIKPHLVDTVMWFSSGGTKSVFHHDDVDNINCLYRGSKTLLFVEYKKYKSKLRLDNAWGGFSGVDVDKVDFTKYPIFHEVEFHEAKMEAGDCLFIPFKWYHQVTSVGSNIAVNIWWKHLSSFIPRKCDGMPPGTLNQFHFSSLHKNGADDAEDEEAETLIDMLAKFIKEKKHVSYDDFVSYLKDNVQTEVKPEFEQDVLEYIGHIFQSADVDKDGSVTIHDITQMDEKAFSEFENDLAELEGILGEYHDPMYQMEDDDRHHEEL